MQQVSVQTIERAVDKRAGQVHREYQEKARNIDRGGVEVGRIERVENKLLSSSPKFKVLCLAVLARPAKLSTAWTIATSRVRVAGPKRGRRGVTRTEEGEKSMAVSFIRSRLS